MRPYCAEWFGSCVSVHLSASPLCRDAQKRRRLRKPDSLVYGAVCDTRAVSIQPVVCRLLAATLGEGCFPAVSRQAPDGQSATQKIWKIPELWLRARADPEPSLSGLFRISHNRWQL